MFSSPRLAHAPLSWSIAQLSKLRFERVAPVAGNLQEVSVILIWVPKILLANFGGVSFSGLFQRNGKSTAV
jgi:hypothetical protein